MRTRTLIIWSTKRNATKNAGEIHLKYVAEAGEPIFTVPDSQVRKKVTFLEIYILQNS